MEHPKTTAIQIGDYELKREVLLDLTKLRDPFSNVRNSPQPIPEGTVTCKGRGEVKPIPIPYWPDEREMTYEWTLLHREQNQKTGYDGALFSAKIDGEEQYFIYHLNADDTGDVGTIGRLVRGERPEQAMNAQDFTDRCVEWIQANNSGKDVRIVDVGYSLGGAMTELVDRKGRPTILFDSPPVSAVLDKEKVPQEQRDRNLLTVVGPHDGIFNSHGRHNGQILVSGEKFWESKHASFVDFWRMNAENHELSFIGKRLEKMSEWKTSPAAEWERPTHLIDAFAAYIEEYTQGHEKSWDEKLLQKQVKFLQGSGKVATEKFAEFVFGLAARVFGAHKAENVQQGKGFVAHVLTSRAERQASSIEGALRREMTQLGESHAERFGSRGTAAAEGRSP